MKLLRKTIIADENGPYLVRWRIIDCRLFGLYLHKILRSDSDRHLHDHPFDFVSIMLAGGYREYYGLGVSLERNAPSIAFRRAEWLHRLEVDPPCWTLIIRGRRRRLWGFQTEHGWVDFKTYLGKLA